MKMDTEELVREIQEDREQIAKIKQNMGIFFIFVLAAIIFISILTITK